MDWILHSMSDGDAAKADLIEKWDLPKALRWLAMGNYHNRMNDGQMKWAKDHPEK